MGIYHLSAKTLKRASGRTPQSASAYRRGIRLVGPDGTVHDYRRRARGVRATAIFAPEGCEWVQDPQALWDRADAAERRQDSRTAREYEVALPADLPWPERQRLAEAFAQHLVAQFGVAVDLAIHEPAADGEHDERNHHAHLLTTTRSVTPDGMGKKTRDLDVKTTSPALIEALRAEWARMANEALAHHNAAEIDHRSHKRRELEVIPTKHEGPKVTWWRRLRVQDEDCADGLMDRARENDEIRVRNASIIERARQRIQRAASETKKNVGGLFKGLLAPLAGFEPPRPHGIEAAIASARPSDTPRAIFQSALRSDLTSEALPLPGTTDAEIIRGIEAAKAGGMRPLAGMLGDQALPFNSSSSPANAKEGQGPREAAEGLPHAQEAHVKAAEVPTEEVPTPGLGEDVDGPPAPHVALEPVNEPLVEAPENTNSRRRRPR